MKWYVYIWKLPNDKPIYIGKGKGERAFWPLNKVNSNKTLDDVIGTLITSELWPTFEVRFVKDEISALKLEELLITEYKLSRLLTNTTYNNVGFSYRAFYREVAMLIEASGREKYKPYPSHLVQAMTKQPWEDEAI